MLHRKLILVRTQIDLSFGMTRFWHGSADTAVFKELVSQTAEKDGMQWTGTLQPVMALAV